MSERGDPASDRAPDAAPDRAKNAEPVSDLAVDAEFALLLTHDVDRPYKTVQSVYHAIRQRDPRQLRSLLPGVNPWWQFEEIMQLEDSLGVRSAFYFLREPHVLARDASDWLDPFYWVEHAGRYDIETPDMLDVLDRLRDGGWEVGLHGSYDSYDDPDRLRTEKTALETALGHGVKGGRQHHLNCEPNTWEHHREIGLRYDASPGSSTEYGFDHGHRPFRPFGDEFVVFPLTLMETALPDPGEEFEAAWNVCERLLEEAAEENAVMSALWHPRLFTVEDFPGHRRIYRRLIERALEMGAWVGSPGEYYDQMTHPMSGKAASDSTDGEAKIRLQTDNAGDNKAPTGINTEPTG